MRVLVTGGAGYIGSHLVDALIKRGDEVLVVDNLSTGRFANIRHLQGHPAFRFINDSILNESLLERLIPSIDLIFHLAAAVGVRHILGDPLAAINTNVRGTEAVLDLAFRYWKRTLIASTSEIYGKASHVPFREDDDRVRGRRRCRAGLTRCPKRSTSTSPSPTRPRGFPSPSSGTSTPWAPPG